MVAEVLGYPENTSLIGDALVQYLKMMVGSGWNDNHISFCQRKGIIFNKNRHLTAIEKIDFIVVVGVVLYIF